MAESNTTELWRNLDIKQIYLIHVNKFQHLDFTYELFIQIQLWEPWKMYPNSILFAFLCL